MSLERVLTGIGTGGFSEVGRAAGKVSKPVGRIVDPAGQIVAPTVASQVAPASPSAATGQPAPTSEEAADAERQRLRRARRATTILTGPLGTSLGPVATPGLVGRASVLGG